MSTKGIITHIKTMHWIDVSPMIYEHWSDEAIIRWAINGYEGVIKLHDESLHSPGHGMRIPHSHNYEPLDSPSGKR